MNMAGFAVAMVVLTSCAGGGNIEGVGRAITLSKPTAHTDGVPADLHQVGSAPGDS